MSVIGAHKMSNTGCNRKSAPHSAVITAIATRKRVIASTQLAAIVIPAV
jgi:hypothetical protein